jgi:hypothetical protein
MGPGPRLRMGLIAGSFVLLSVAAVTGWVRKPVPSATVPYGSNAEPVASPATANMNAPPAAPAGNAYDNSYTQPASNQPASYDAYGRPVDRAAAAYNPATTNPATTACVEGQQSYAAAPYATTRYVRTVRPSTYGDPPRSYYVGTGRTYYAGHRRIRHRRSLGKSVAIVAGSAGVGSAIGAIAGGGKGAGIGALAGGAGGFIYDRLTHNQ